MRLGRGVFVLTVPLMSVLTSCATVGTSTFQSVAPPSMQIENSVLLDKPFEEVWDKLVGQLSKSFYVINNIDKASRIINVSLSSEDPDQYIDCGHTHRTFAYAGQTEEFNYAIAGSSSYKAATQTTAGNPVTLYVDRKTSLEGRVNVYVAPEGNGTRVSVNARYVLTIATSGQSEAHALVGPAVATAPLQESSSTVTLNTDQPTTKNLGSAREPLNRTS